MSNQRLVKTLLLPDKEVHTELYNLQEYNYLSMHLLAWRYLAKCCFSQVSVNSSVSIISLFYK
jgi:hypothetical protein